jgi:hypothetical protein
MKCFLRVVIGAILLGSVGAQAFDPYGESRDIWRWGFELEQFKGGDSDLGTQGAMLGLHSSIYPFSYHRISIGTSLYLGTAHGGDTSRDNLAYGGLTLGAETTLLRLFELNLKALIGYGYGTSPQVTGQSVAIQPTLAAGLVLVNGWRASFVFGYLMMPSANGFTSRTYGIRLERKIETTGTQGLNY